MKKAYLYTDKRSLNDATNYYVGIVEKSLNMVGFEMQTVFNLNEIKKPNLIFTITSIYFVKAKLKFPFVKTLTWRQGLGYQEALMGRPYWKCIGFALAEWVTCKMCDYLLYVSKQMQEYYRDSFGYKKDNYDIMPCYNMPLFGKCNIEKFKSPTFVYAGGISKWQSIDVILDTYSIIEKHLPNASLHLYCKDSSFLRNEISKRGIKNVSIKYVPVEQLQKEMLNYKYGFLLREKNWVNLVATPTKMNSYLASYVIPIYSNGVNDFERNIKLGEFTLMGNTPLKAQDIAEKVIAFEKQEHDYSHFVEYTKSIFDSHYNDRRYIDIISKGIKKWIEK